MSRIFRGFLFASAIAVTSPALADCGQLGIGGTVGKWCDDVSHQVTPLLQKATEMANAIGGGVGSAMLGLPPELGVQLGDCYGQTVNSIAAGNGTPKCVDQLPQQISDTAIDGMLHQARQAAYARRRHDVDDIPSQMGRNRPVRRLGSTRVGRQGYDDRIEVIVRFHRKPGAKPVRITID